MHWHSEFEINFVRTGSAEFTCGEQKFRSADGDIIVIPPNVMHSVYPCPEMHQIYDTLVFSPELFGSSESDRCIQECVKPLTTGSMQIQMHITPKHHYYRVMESIVETVFACAKEDTPQLDMLLRGELFRFFWLLETEAEMVPNFQSTLSSSETVIIVSMAGVTVIALPYCFAHSMLRVMISSLMSGRTPSCISTSESLGIS